MTYSKGIFKWLVFSLIMKKVHLNRLHNKDSKRCKCTSSKVLGTTTSGWIANYIYHRCPSPIGISCNTFAILFRDTLTFPSRHHFFTLSKPLIPFRVVGAIEPIPADPGQVTNLWQGTLTLTPTGNFRVSN